MLFSVRIINLMISNTYNVTLFIGKGKSDNRNKVLNLESMGCNY